MTVKELIEKIDCTVVYMAANVCKFAAVQQKTHIRLLRFLFVITFDDSQESAVVVLHPFCAVFCFVVYCLCTQNTGYI